MSFLEPHKGVTTRCSIPELSQEVSQRLPAKGIDAEVEAALWVEPLVQFWESDLAELARVLPEKSTMVVIASLPLARLLPERQGWAGDPMCLHPGGLGRLNRALMGTNFIIQDKYGFHTPYSVVVNSLSRWLDRWGRPDLGDRVGFAGRLRYCTTGPTLVLSTVALITARQVTS